MKYSKQIAMMLWGQQNIKAAYYMRCVYLPFIMTAKHNYNF
jgi:hypothetical protein